MVANIAETKTGNKMFASFRTGAWWGQGEVFDDPGLTGREVLKLAKLDWKVHKVETFAPFEFKGETQVYDVPMSLAIVRDPVGGEDQPSVLGTVGAGYEMFQNQELVDMMDALAGDGSIQYEVAGALGKGEIVWVLAKIPNLEKAIGEDVSIPYFLSITGHIGNKNQVNFPTGVRVVCQNTMRMAEYLHRGKVGLSRGYSFRHTKNIRDKVNDMIANYHKAIEAWDRTHEINKALAGIQFDTKMKDDFLLFMADPDYSPKVEEARQKAIDEATDKDVREKLEKRSDNQTSRRKNKVEALEKILASPTCQVNGTKDTLYSLLQAGIEWIDHERSTRGEGDQEKASSRFESANFAGSGVDLKERAFARAMEVLQAA